MASKKGQERIPTVIEIQQTLRQDLDDYKVVTIRASEIMQKDRGDGRVRRFIGDQVEVLDERDVNPFLKIAANYMRKQIVAAQNKKGETR